jgi:hypothetical protein
MSVPRVLGKRAPLKVLGSVVELVPVDVIDGRFPLGNERLGHQSMDGNELIISHFRQPNAQVSILHRPAEYLTRVGAAESAKR